MAWQYKIDETRQIFLLEFIDEMTAKDIEEATLVAVDLQKNQKVLRYFSDLTNIIITSPLNDIYSLASSTYTELGAHPLVRYAMLPPKDEVSRKVVEIYQLTSQHRDRQIQIFDSKDDAYRWLMGKEAKPKSPLRRSKR